jgi:Zn ribbon nucleic-acid-binding protein
LRRVTRWEDLGGWDEIGPWREQEVVIDKCSKCDFEELVEMTEHIRV